MKKRGYRFNLFHVIITGIILVGFVSISFFAGRVLLQSRAVGKIPRAISHLPQKAVCGNPGIGKARCNAHVVTDSSGVPLAGSIPPSTSYGPSEFHFGYDLPCTVGGVATSPCATPSAGFGPQTIAVVDAYNTPSVENDLGVYSTYYKLPLCSKANGCLKIINQNGGTVLPTTVDSGWALETSLDVQIAHTICQTCKILLLEANSNSISDLATAVQTAANMGATAISNSYGGQEWSGEVNYDSLYNHPGVAITASSGDNGYGTEYPASSKGVVAVGGTTLLLNTDNSYASEVVWNGTGSGCSTYETANVWQTATNTWGQTGCGTRRGISDIAADADPNTGAAVYDTTPYNGSTGWYQVGGTSLSSPLIAAMYALTGGVTANTNAASLAYAYFAPNNSHDILAGSNGVCTTIMCIAAPGYDGPSGLGSANGIGGFMIAPASPTPSQTPTPTSVVTPTLTPTPTQSSNDTTSPLVTITNPTSGSNVQRGSKVTISAIATDDVEVAQVVFFVNGSALCTDLGSPYSCTWKVPNGRKATYTLTATATDTSGNTASSTIKVNAQ